MLNRQPARYAEVTVISSFHPDQAVNFLHTDHGEPLEAVGCAVDVAVED